MNWSAPLKRAELVARINRYTASVRVDGRPDYAFVANTGRLQELMIPGEAVLLRPAANPDRRTVWDLVAVDHGGIWVCIDTGIPNKLTRDGLEKRILPFHGPFRPEVRFGEHSRVDFRVEPKGTPPLWLEVKSCTLVVKGCAIFPDAPTERGTRHLHHLTEKVQEGERAGVLFVIQREDGERFAPNEVTDPVFATAFREAVEAGVEAHAWACKITTRGVKFLGPVPVGTTFKESGLRRQDVPCR